MKQRYLKLYALFNELLAEYEQHNTNLVYVALIALRTELYRLYAKLQGEGEVQTQDEVPPPPPTTLPPPPSTNG